MRITEDGMEITLEEALALEMLLHRAYVTKHDKPEVLQVSVNFLRGLRVFNVIQLENPAFIQRDWLKTGVGLALFSDWMRYGSEST